MQIGYARVSTLDQDTALQLDALEAAGIRDIYSEHGSGVGPRPQLQRAIAHMSPGDVLVVWKLDRIARSLLDLLAILDRLKQAGASIRSLTEPIDTTTPIGGFVVQILGAVAELERNIIIERTKAGLMAARSRGAPFGRPHLLNAELSHEVRERWNTGAYTMTSLAELYGVSCSTVWRVIRTRQ